MSAYESRIPDVITEILDPLSHIADSVAVGPIPDHCSPAPVLFVL